MIWTPLYGSCGRPRRLERDMEVLVDAVDMRCTLVGGRLELERDEVGDEFC